MHCLLILSLNARGKLRFAILLVTISASSLPEGRLMGRPQTANTPCQVQDIDIYEVIHKKADLPGPGEFILSPKEKAVVYYYTNTLRMWGNKDNFKKHPGLYVSKNHGETWRLTCYIFEFHRLYVHPDTGHLFAILDYTWLTSDGKDGFLTRAHSNKVVASQDGRKWKDITGTKQGYITGLESIFADPDNPGRICLTGNLIRSYVFQSKDEDYSDWIWHAAFLPEGKRLLQKGKTEK